MYHPNLLICQVECCTIQGIRKPPEYLDIFFKDWSVNIIPIPNILYLFIVIVGDKNIFLSILEKEKKGQS